MLGHLPDADRHFLHRRRHCRHRFALLTGALGRLLRLRLQIAGGLQQKLGVIADIPHHIGQTIAHAGHGCHHAARLGGRNGRAEVAGSHRFRHFAHLRRIGAQLLA